VTTTLPAPVATGPVASAPVATGPVAASPAAPRPSGATSAGAPLTRTWRPPRSTDMAGTLRPLQHGVEDPSCRRTADGSVWRACRTPAGPGTLRLRQFRDGDVETTAWGPGAQWLLDGVPALLGDEDTHDGHTYFAGSHRVLHEAGRRFADWRVCRSRLVWESLVPVILEQKVTGLEAKRSWRRLLTWFGEPAPGPGCSDGRPLRLIPDPAGWARIPSWDWHRAGVGPERARRIVTVARLAGRLEESVDMDAAAASARLQAAPGIGVWTAAEVLQRAHGDPDAVSFGDFHVAKDVTWAFTGVVGDDEGMARVLEPWRGQRYRVCVLLAMSGIRRPRHGPRLSPADYRAI